MTATVVVANRIKETALAEGLGNLTLQGAVTGYRAFADGLPVGATTIYVIQDGEAWECGIGVLVSETELSRATILDSSATSTRVNSNEAGTPIKLSLTTGTHTVICSPLVQNAVFRDSDGGIVDPSPFRKAVFVQNIAAMKALDGLEDAEAVFVIDGTSAGDGNGGIFQWDEDDATAPDNVDTFRDDNYAEGLWKRRVTKIREYADDMFEIDAASGDGGRLRMFANPKSGAANDWVQWYVDRAASAWRAVVRWGQAGATNFISLFSFGTTADRVEIHQPIVLPARTDASGFQARSMAWLSGTSRLAYGAAAAMREIPLTSGGYIQGVHNTVTALKEIDAAALAENGGKAAVLGESAFGDCQPFFVEWSSSSSATEDLVNVFRPSTGAAASGNGRWLRSTTSTSRAFTSGDATPSIKNGDFFTTAGATTITRFDDGFEGQSFTVQRGASDIIIQHGSDIALGGQNVTLTTGRPRALFKMVGGVAYLQGGFVTDFAQPAMSATSAHGFAKAVSTASKLQVYTDLQALTSPATNILYFVAGRATAGDYGGGFFRWVSGDQSAAVTSDPAHGVYVPPASDTSGASGVWVRQWDGIEVLVDYFGAKGDSATDDAAAINAACAFMGGLGGGIVRIRAALYIIGSGIQSNLPYVRLCGAGDVSEIRATFAAGDIICFGDGTVNVGYNEVCDLTVSCSTPKSSGAAIRFRNCHLSKAERFRLGAYLHTGVQVDGGAGHYECRIKSFEINSSSYAAILLGAAGGPASDVFLSDGEVAGCGRNLLIVSASGVYVDKVSGINAAIAGVQTMPGSGQEVNYCFFVQTLMDTGAIGWDITDNGGKVFQFHATQCWGASSTSTTIGYGFRVKKVTGTINGVSFTGCIAINNNLDGFFVEDGQRVSISKPVCSQNSKLQMTISASAGDGFTIATNVLTRAAGGSQSFITDGVKVGQVARLGAIATGGDIGRNCLITAVTATTVTLSPLTGGALTNIVSPDTDATLTFGGCPGIRFGAGMTHFGVDYGRSGYDGVVNELQTWGVFVEDGPSDFYNICGVDVDGNLIGGVYDGGTGVNKTVGSNPGQSDASRPYSCAPTVQTGSITATVDAWVKPIPGTNLLDTTINISISAVSSPTAPLKAPLPQRSANKTQVFFGRRDDDGTMVQYLIAPNATEVVILANGNGFPVAAGAALFGTFAYEREATD